MSLQLRRVRVEVVGIVSKAVGLEEAPGGSVGRGRGLGELGPGDLWEKVGGTTEGECEVRWTSSF